MKNFLPGPTEVNPDVLEQLSKPILGHHTDEFQNLLRQIDPRLKNLMGTRDFAFTFTCTASAAMEAALANVDGEKVLVLANGAFGERWLSAARSLGMKADGLIMAWGLPLPEYEIGRVLDRTNCDTLVMVHGESSTGMLNPLQPTVSALSHRPEVFFILDAVATLGGVPLNMEDSKVDILVGASQKCLALPPGLVPIGASARVIEKSRNSKRKGYAYDFVLWQERWEESSMVATPAIPQLQALNFQLGRIEKETLSARWERHQKMSQSVLAWASHHGFVSFAPEGFSLPSVSCLRPLDGRNTDYIVNRMRQKGYLIDNGYGKLRNKTLRIGHMGDWTEKDVQELLRELSDALD